MVSSSNNNGFVSPVDGADWEGSDLKVVVKERTATWQKDPTEVFLQSGANTVGIAGEQGGEKA